jgi:multiple sugar transport system substrate-binding protein
MSDNSAREQEPSHRKQAVGRTLGLVTIILALIACTSLGSVLVNVDWPGGSVAWIRVAIGAVLLTLALLCGELLIRILYDLRRGRSESRNITLLNRLGTALVKGKRITAVLAIAVAWFLVAWLTPPVFTAPKAEPLIEPGKLVLMTAIDESPSDPRRILIEQWNQAHPESPISVENVGGEPDAQHDAMVANAKGQRGERADVYILDVIWMTEFIARDHIQPLDETGLSTDDFLPNVLRTCRDLYGDRDGLWALPLNTDAGLLYYRTDLPHVAESDGWDDIFGTNAKSTFTTVRNTPGFESATGKLKGTTAAQLVDEEVLAANAFEAMWAAGGELVNEDGSVVFNDAGDEVDFDSRAREGLRKLATAYDDASALVPGADRMTEDDATVAFANEQAMFMRNWPVAHDTLTAFNGETAVPFDVKELPGDSVLGGQNVAIARETDKPHAAQALIEFLTSAPSQLILFEAGGFAPTRDSAYTHSTRPYKDLLRGAVIDARPRPFLPRYQEFSKEFRLGMMRALKNDGTIEPELPKILARIAKMG